MKQRLYWYGATAFALMLCATTAVLSQGKDRDGDEQIPALRKTAGIEDRAAGIHNASNIGLFFENRGKLYPRRLAQGPSGEFPINSGEQYIYRMAPYVGVPGNVVQGRYRTDEEWEAVGGYHNRELAKIAFSDNPASWNPGLGWPVKDGNGNPVFKSDQDSYCVYSDSNNSRQMLGVVVAQTGYAYGVKFAQNLLFLKYELTNHGSRDLDSVYLGIYCDIDVGSSQTGGNEYADDKIGFDKGRNLVYFYDKGTTAEWPSGKSGYFGCTFLKTPLVGGVEPGISDMHYFLYYDDSNNDIDSVLYGIMSSSPTLYASGIGNKYFHLGPNPNIHYDDPATIPAAGLDIVAMISSGPYTLRRGDTLVFYTALAAGTTKDEILGATDQARRILQYDFEISKPPATPKLTGIPGDRRVTLFWDDKAEQSKDNYSGQYDFEGYRLYRSVDKGVTWTLLADYDVTNSIGLDRGIQYSYLDTALVNGVEYWYTLTAFDRGDANSPSLESPKGKTLGTTNLAVLIPRSEAAGRTPVRSDLVQHAGGKSNYTLNVSPIDNVSLANSEYSVAFTYTSRLDLGTLKTRARTIIQDSAAVLPHSYEFEFLSPTQVNLVDLTTGEDVGGNPKNYNKNTGMTYTVQTKVLQIRLEEPNPGAPADQLPKAGDKITVNFSIQCLRNGIDTVIAPRPFRPDKIQSTYDGIVLSATAPEMIQNVSRVAGTDNSFVMTFSVSRTDSIRNNRFLVTTTGGGFSTAGKAFVSISVRDSSNVVIKTVDTLFALGAFEFRGVGVRVDFPTSRVPAAGITYALQTVVPVSPSLRDRYRFTVLGPAVDRAVAASALTSIRVVPNPYIVASLYEPEFGEWQREPARQIQFTNLPVECTIHIFTLDGNRVKTLRHSSQNGTAPWDLRAEGGREVAAGIYLYVVTTPSGEFKGRFAVIK